MKNFEFKSQICTTKEQSERLLALGLKPETADIRLRWLYCYRDEDYYQPIPNDFATSYDDTPAWSLHRLIETIDYPSNIDAIKELLAAKTMFNNRLYDRVIDIIEYLIQKDEFNKDYLEEKK